MSLKDEPTLFLFRKMLKFSDKKKVFFGIFFMSIAFLIWLFEIYLVGFILNKIQNEGINQENIMTILLLFLSFIPITFFAYWSYKIGFKFIIKNAFLVKLRYRKYLLKNIFNLKLKWHNNQKTGDIIDKVNKSATYLNEFSWLIHPIVNFFTDFISVYIILIFFNIHLLYITPILFFLIIRVVLVFDKKLVPMHKEFNLKENKIVEKIFDYISNITTILILKIKKYL